jgi:hypothetical protein
MSTQPLLAEPPRVDEPRESQAFSEALTRVAVERLPVIVRRDGEDLAAVVPLEHLELLRETLARQEVEKLAARINWDQAVKTLRAPQSWFDNGDNPCEPDEESAP